jgi:hypothetical protein
MGEIEFAALPLALVANKHGASSASPACFQFSRGINARMLHALKQHAGMMWSLF